MREADRPPARTRILLRDPGYSLHKDSQVSLEDADAAKSSG